MGKYLIWPCIILLFLSLIGCNGEKPAHEEKKPGQTISVVTTIFPLYDIVKQLGGDKVSTNYLLPAGASPHTYEATVEQARLIEGADLFVYIGAGLDEWAFKLAHTANPALHILELAPTLELLEQATYYPLQNNNHIHHNCHDCAEEPASINEHTHEKSDPHFWLDPILVRDKICPLLTKELSALSPDHAPYFNEKLEKFQGQLTLLHEEIANATCDFPKKGFISFHSAWQYFANRYGLKELAVLARFPGQEPSAGEVAELVNLIREENIGAILTEPQFSPRLAEGIAKETGIKVLTVDPLGGSSIPDRKSYVDIMRFNLHVFQEALQ